MGKAYKITGYILDSSNYYGDCSSEDFENWLDGTVYFGSGEFHSAVFSVESKEVLKEDIIDEDGMSSEWDEEDFKKYFKE